VYVANADSLMRYPYTEGDTKITATGTKVIDLPGAEGALNHHWTKSLLASPDGKKLYVGVGSKSVRREHLDVSANARNTPPSFGWLRSDRVCRSESGAHGQQACRRENQCPPAPPERTSTPTRRAGAHFIFIRCWP
jgi:glucose/arabinose dehydrogenase